MGGLVRQIFFEFTIPQGVNHGNAQCDAHIHLYPPSVYNGPAKWAERRKPTGLSAWHHPTDLIFKAGQTWIRSLETWTPRAGKGDCCRMVLGTF